MFDHSADWQLKKTLMQALRTKGIYGCKIRKGIKLQELRNSGCVWVRMYTTTVFPGLQEWIFPRPKHLKKLDPSYKTDLEFGIGIVLEGK